jgi:hypothetical protein
MRKSARPSFAGPSYRIRNSLCHLTARTRRNPKKVKAASRPQYYRIKRIVDMVREGSAEGYLPSCSDYALSIGADARGEA